MSQRGEIKSFFMSISETETLEWSKGEFLCREEGALERLHYILSGKFRVFRSLSNGREKLYRIYMPGAVIGDLEVFLGSEAASCSVQCIEGASTLSLPMSSINGDHSLYHELIFALGRGLARKVHENSVSEAINTSYSLEVRLAHYFLVFSEPDLRAQTLGQLSDWMGCSYRHLTRSLSALVKRGALNKVNSGEGYVAADREILAEIAGPILLEKEKRLFESGGE